MANKHWLSDKAWACIGPLLPKVHAGARRKDDRRLISGIIHVLRSGCRWQGPSGSLRPCLSKPIRKPPPNAPIAQAIIFHKIPDYRNRHVSRMLLCNLCSRYLQIWVKAFKVGRPDFSCHAFRRISWASVAGKRIGR
jgi:transposase